MPLRLWKPAAAAVVAAAAALWWQSRDLPTIAGADHALFDSSASIDESSSSAAAASTPSRVVTAPAARSESVAPTGQAPGGEGGDDNVFVIESSDDFFNALSALGVNNYQQQMDAWAAARGYQVFGPDGLPVSQQPYGDYDDQTLRTLARGGDIHAMKTLADRLVRASPAEALELYRQAAAAGSLQAMEDLARMHGLLARERVVRAMREEGGKQQSEMLLEAVNEPEVEAYAWMVAAEMSGWDPSRSAARAKSFESGLDEAQRQAACEMAPLLLQELSAIRAGKGQAPLAPSSPPPVAIQKPGWQGATDCFDPQDNIYTRNGCRQATFRQWDKPVQVWICDQGN